MTKNGKKSMGEKKSVKKILITQPKPDSTKSPYFELAKILSFPDEFELPQNAR